MSALGFRAKNLDPLQIGVIAAALLCAVLLLVITPEAHSEPALNVDRDPEGAPYVAGELLVSYKSGTEQELEKSIAGKLNAKTQDILEDQETRLLSFPAIKDEEFQEEREDKLAEKLRDLESDPQVEAAEYNYVRTISYTPNDPQFTRQWGLRKAGFREAWNITRGRKGIKIAVVDSGIYARHPDISKIAAQRDFVEGNRVADDEIGHGTHVAGIVAAVTNNRKGVAGACPSCKLLIAKVVGRRVATDVDIAKGINWSVRRGADVINLSLGGSGKSAILARAVNNAWQKGVVVTSAAGNNKTSRPIYPAAYPKAIAVSATTRGDRRATFSNRGNWVDLAAPGVDILSTVPNKRYRVLSGTSTSSPHVAGLAGLLASQGLSAGQIRTRMESTAKDLGRKGRDPYYGYGRIDATAAIR